MADRIKAGDHLPDVTLMTIHDDEPQPVRASDFFAARRVALFAVPGAWTPTCSQRHLPSFVEAAPALAAAGIDAIACTAVNDIFALSAWLSASGAEAIIPLADGNGAFARATGLDLDASAFGMGVRSHRYALVATDGVVEWLAVDRPGEYRESAAEHLLSALPGLAAR